MLSRFLEKIRDSDAEDPSEDTLELAAAVLFFEVAWADHVISDAELQVVRNALVTVFDIDDKTVDELIETSKERHDESVGMHRFTRAIVDAWSVERRVDLVVQLWRLALSDDQLDKYEEATIRKIAELLYIGHGKFIEAKLIAKQLVEKNQPRFPIRGQPLDP